ncbi:NIPSNAP family protein [Ottowia sp. VDI28]|uniref:NIPSNAP family protein n=1 Tax=Ottowia sp. VDI28 TaxID=3133968 RepID=UPI003C2F001B
MIIEFRTYTVAHGQMDDYLQRYEARGLPLLQRHLGRQLGCYVSEIGTLNQVRHVWEFDSFSDREQRRSRLEADPEWQDFKRLNRGTFTHQEVCIMKPTRFSQTIV